MSVYINNLTKHFHRQIVFEKLNAEFKSGKTTLISGPSGCGKTTLLRIIAGLDKKYTGSVKGVPEEISYLFQEDRLMPWFTLKQNVEFVLKDIYEPAKATEAALAMIKDVRLNGHEDKYPSKLSGGMQRRTALARAFCYPSELILLDEPFKGMDAKLKLDMIELFEQLFVKQNKTVILVTHDETVIERFSSNCIEL